MRSSWGGFARLKPWPVNGRTPIGTAARLVFVLGLRKSSKDADDDVAAVRSGSSTIRLAKEIRIFDDIVLGDFVDDYVNLTLKSLLILKMMSEQCRNARFLLKCDQDVFVNVPHVVDLLRGVAGVNRTFIGRVRRNQQPWRSGKYKVTEDEYPLDVFPPYVRGPAYVVTNDLARDLLEAAEYVPSLVLEDVFITVILGQVLAANHARMCTASAIETETADRVDAMS